MTTEKPRAYTPEEIRRILFAKIWHTINYWHDDERTQSTYGKMTGLVHSLLAMLDGATLELPGFLVTPDPHPDDRDYHISQGENYFPEDKPDLGSLHELLYVMGRELKLYRELEDSR